MEILGIKIQLWPTYCPDKRPQLPRTSRRTSTDYDYSRLSITPDKGVITRTTIAADKYEFDVVSPATDMGRRQQQLSAEDRALLAERQLDLDRAAFLKPIWAAGATAKLGAATARSRLKAQKRSTWGYSDRKVQDYWAAFNAAKPSPTAAIGE